MTSALTARDAATALAGVDQAFLAYGTDAGGDVDAAFDDATEQAGYDYGFAGLVPSIAGVDADSVTVATLEPVTLARGLLLATRALHGEDLEPNRAYAVPICPDSTYKRTRARVTFTDPALEIAETSGALTLVTEPLEDRIREAAAEAGLVIDAAALETVAATAARHRYRPLVTAFKGASTSEFVAIDPTTRQIVSAGHRTAGDARRTAVALAKEGPIGGSATGSLEILKVTRRPDGDPLARVTRTRVASRVTLKAVFGEVKNPAKVKTVGWLFYGTQQPEAPTDPAAAATSEASDAAVPE